MMLISYRLQLSNRNVLITLKTRVSQFLILKHQKFREVTETPDNGRCTEGMATYEARCNYGSHTRDVRSLHQRRHLAGPDPAQLRYNKQQSIKHHSSYTGPGVV